MKQDETPVVCILDKTKMSQCHPPKDIPECHSCGWEETEAMRRKKAIQADWTKPNMEAGTYYLSIRKGIDNAGHDNE
ncbi:MAG: hypothetical protein LIO70_01295 [Clostridiales bacterium]|nr:hypothetical protein [Clostridiales bacterium]